MSSDPFHWVGQTIDAKYRIDALVGLGGFGVVYRGHHLGFGERVAVKCLRVPETLDGANRARFFESFLAEGRLLHQLSRSTAGIVQALDVGAATAPSGVWTPYLVLEWLEGRSLEADLQGRDEQGLGGRSLSEAIDLLDPAARALAVAHEQGVAHRDVKPANLFLADVGGRQTVKVLDFGIAKVITETQSITKAFEATGRSLQAFTAHYGAPEQFSRRFGATGPWTDVFALALVLVELVSGRRALDGADAAQLFVSSADANVRPGFGSAGVAVPGAVEDVVLHALAVDPKERYATALEFWNDLLSAVAQTTGHRPPAVSAPVMRFTPLAKDGARSALDSARFAALEAPTQLATSSQVPLDRQKPESLRAPARHPTFKRLVSAVLVGVVVFGTAGYVGNHLWREPSSEIDPMVSAPIAPVPPPSAEPPALPALIRVPAGIAPGGTRWLAEFRFSRPTPGAQRAPLPDAHARCEGSGLGLCTETQWIRACELLPDLGREPSWTISAVASGFVVRGGEGCGSRSIAGSDAQRDARGGVCCERAVAIETSNRNKNFLLATTQRLLTFESLLNQRQTIKLSEMLEESVELDGVSKPRASALRVIEGPGSDAWTMLDTCVVEMSPASKGKKGERASWSAECEETRHAAGTLSSASRRYVFSGAGTLLAIDNP